MALCWHKIEKSEKKLKIHIRRLLYHYIINTFIDILLDLNQQNLVIFNVLFIIEIENDENPEDFTCVVVFMPEKLK